MTGMNEAQIKHLARLARLALTDDDVRALAPELAGIVRHVDSLAAVDTGGTAPMVHGAPLPLPGDLDEPGPRPPRDQAILGRDAVAGSAGLEDDGTVRVPRVVD
jgi:aspartyl-tRNA(Asn)/glutamyl-tRNA(Gln) amidotransferase subunit C